MSEFEIMELQGSNNRLRAEIERLRERLVDAGEDIVRLRAALNIIAADGGVDTLHAAKILANMTLGRAE